MIERNITKRWEQGIPHHPSSVALFKRLEKIDLELCGDYFRWKSGGDGDNGEILMYELDIIFEEVDQKFWEENDDRRKAGQISRAVK